MNIFDRLPLGLFGPLTGRNGRRMWDLIGRLAQQFFGPDCIPPYAEGYLHEQITKEIERFLLDAQWEDEERGEILTTPLNSQANNLQERLVSTGWLIEDRVGARVFVSMRPVVARFFETVHQFVEDGPPLIGGNVQLVFNQLRSVVESPREQAQGFISAAQLCVRLIHSLSATTLRARDLIRELLRESETPAFVRRFFGEHISELYVRDFKNLRTENHPLRLRGEILDMVSQVTTDPVARAELLAGYAAIAKSSEVPEQMLDRDIRRFERLIDVQQFIDRMDQVMEQAGRIAASHLEYRLKATDRIESTIEDTIRALQRAETLGIDVEGSLFTPPGLVSEARLRLPTPAPVKQVRQPMRKREMTLQERAAQLLRREMTQHRDSSPKVLQAYVASHLKPGETLAAQSLPVDKVEDAVAFLALVHIGSIARHAPRAIQQNPLLRRMDFEVELLPFPARVQTPLFDAPDFVIRRKGSHAS
jgi:hypothetical protein